ncbi:MAG: exodeoxyribonuclease VII small subunit [Burkholderiales bacterium]|nr:exodeoxyribonuclease VII small subunit [Burkholderiales bacterium]
MSDKKSTLNFEKAIAELESIVNQMENNETPLDVALDKYQSGISLIKFCQDKLREAEQKIKILDPESNSLKDFLVHES